MRSSLPRPPKFFLLRPGPSARAISVDDLMLELQRSMAASGKQVQVTKQQLLDALHQMGDLISFDRRTNVVKPHAAVA